jgi:hypothetical protein
MEKAKMILLAMSEITGKQLGNTAIALMLSDLKDYSESEVIDALGKCRREVKYFPTISDIVERIPDGHLSPSEAWAKIPRDEYQSVAWTKEIEKAYFDCRDILRDGDRVAARMAFIESYKKRVSEAKNNGERAHWKLGRGDNKAEWEDVKREVARLNGQELPALEEPEEKKAVAWSAEQRAEFLNSITKEMDDEES